MRIAIIGAGPAGSYLAWQLINSNHEVCLFDHLAPYEKFCGGGLSPLVTEIFNDVMALPFIRNHPQKILLLSSSQTKVKELNNHSSCSIVSRLEFAKALLKKTLEGENIQFIRERVTKIYQKNNCWSLQTSDGNIYQADFIVGADGVISLVRHNTIGDIPKKHLGLAVGYFVHGIEKDIIIFKTFNDLEGYLWCFPRQDYASVGIGSRLNKINPKKLWQWLEQFLKDSFRKPQKKIQWSALLPMAYDRSLWDTPQVGKNWALIGDAAGNTHPITGEGIIYALWSGKLLAEAFKQHDPLAYESLWRISYGDKLIKSSDQLRRNIDYENKTYETILWEYLEESNR